ncbi:endolytic transglycosylase MltG, partial [Thermodesulfobacteriota bacterium]
MKLFIRVLSVLVLIICCVFVYVSISFNKFANSVPDSKNIVKVINIQQGENATSIINKLEDEGVITSSTKFYYFAKLTNKLDIFKYGEYEFTTSQKPFEVLSKLVSGDIKKYSVTIPEGYNLHQIAESLALEINIKKDAFLEKVLSAEFAASFDIDAPTLEGYLFPDTYYVTKEITIDAMVAMMVQNYKRNFSDKMRARATQLNMTEHAVVTLASIIEKE